MAKETHAFQAEIKELLNLMIHSLYSHKEIFLRELISNASDAIDKLKFECLTKPELIKDGIPFEIRVIPDKNKKTLTIIDNGIGMNKDEVIEFIGTIAHSGTKKFSQIAKECKNNPELIGQFGVGFYSSFMVADHVTLHTQKAGTTLGTLWSSASEGSYTIDEVPRPGGHGTSIVLHLKPQEQLENQDYLDEWTLKDLIKKYSDFIAYPIVMKTSKSEPEKDDKGENIKDKWKTVEADETLNSQKALWLRSQNEISTEEYHDFYRHITHDWNEPIKTIHFKAEGTLEYTALIYIPKTKPFNYNYKDYTHGLDLYVKRVFIMHDCEELIPPYLRFLKGLIDSSDLSLNISREMVQQNYQVDQIKKSLTSKILNSLKEMSLKTRDEFEKIWNEFGETLKEGIASDPSNKDKILEFSLFRSNKSEKLTTLDEYISRMKPDQKCIYYLTAESLPQAKNSPCLEKLNEKEYEVLLLCDIVDEWVANSINEFKKTTLQNITQDDLKFDSEKNESPETKKELEQKLAPLLTKMKETLKDQINDVRISSRLTHSPACLVSMGHIPSKRMEKILSSLGQNATSQKRIMEVNAEHPIFAKMLDSNPEKQKMWSEIIFNQALLSEGSPLPDPIKFSKQISELLLSSE